MQIGVSSKDQEEMDKRSQRAHTVIKLLKKKLSLTSPLGKNEQEMKRNRLWLNEEQTQFPAELLKPAAKENAAPGRYQLRSMKKSISDALSSPFRIRSSTPDAPKAKGNKKKEATEEAGEHRFNPDEEVDMEDPGLNGEEDIQAPFPTNIGTP